jgi:ribosomal-protein-alanine N-acetyltransferase
MTTASERVESARLILSTYTTMDLDALFEIHSDPQVGEFTFSPTRREEAAARYEAAEAQRPVFGVAPWVAREPDGALVGYGGLLIDTFDPGWGVEVAYFLSPAYWNRGYATEIARTAVGYGFGTLKLDRLVSFAQPENAASVRVLENVGMRFIDYLPEMNRNYYELTASSFERG